MPIDSGFIESLEIKLQRFRSIPDPQEIHLQEFRLLFSLFFEKLTQDESVQFSTLFSRIAYAGVQMKLPGKLIFESQRWRRTIQKRLYDAGHISRLIKEGTYLLAELTAVIPGVQRIEKYARPGSMDKENVASIEFKRILRACLLEVHDTHIVVVDEDKPHIKLQVRFDDMGIMKQAHDVIKYFDLPLEINLVDVNYETESRAKAMMMVLRPDFLLGVTSISECYSSEGSTALSYLAKKLIPSDMSVHMLIGNIVNYYLDELVHRPDISFKDLHSSIFRLAPIAFSRMDDEELRKVMAKIEVHFHNLKQVVSAELKEVGITKEAAYLEPSFYSNAYGLQGRLDLFHHEPNKRKADIVELKSGKLYKAHAYGLNQNHYIQTLLYDLIIESVFGYNTKANNYILYSSLKEKRLRYAPKVRGQQLDAIKLRNNIILLEELLCRIDQEDIPDVISKLDPERIPEAYTFLRRDAESLHAALRDLNELERSYYLTFLAFLSREFHFSKVGRHGINSSNGLASLWLDPMIEKVDRFSVLSDLEILSNDTDAEVPTMKLGFSEASNRLSRFRVGDICILYPYDQVEGKAVLSNQLFKCTILELTGEGVSIRLRARQKNAEIFKKNRFWNLEGDMLDSGFNQQFHGLYGFISASRPFRELMLGLRPPGELTYVEDVERKERLTDQQYDLIKNAIAAKEYYLIWGPPGTGKTSIVISSLIQHYYNATKKNVLLLAYTNRAVDEICSAIDGPTGGDFIRIGSRYATKTDYRKKLLVNRSEEITRRTELNDMIMDSRIFVSTVSSFQGKKDLSDLKQFDLVIIDEASQLLEPMLVGLLSRFKKFILIGDHKQLPAVVTQSKEGRRVKKERLVNEIGLRDCGMSLFERLFYTCQTKKWAWAYGVLDQQGRMHQDILQFVSKEFYEGQLRVLEGVRRLVNDSDLKSDDELSSKLVKHRMIFIDTPIDESITRKTNQLEAQVVNGILGKWKEIYGLNGMPVHEDAIGVITPFRSQIAMIRKTGDKDLLKDVTIDTIERYQGGARERIIISLAVNEADLLDTITSMSEQGIDRKMNVALSRAKEHLVIIGNKEVLSKNKLYQQLIESCHSIDHETVLEVA